MDGRAVFTEVEMKGFRKLETLKMSKMIILEGTNGFSRLGKSRDIDLLSKKEAKETPGKRPVPLSPLVCFLRSRNGAPVNLFPRLRAA